MILAGFLLQDKLQRVLKMIFYPLSVVNMSLQRTCLKELHNAELYCHQTKAFSLIMLWSLLKPPAWAMLAIKFPLLNLRLPQLIRYTIILLVKRAYAKQSLVIRLISLDVAYPLSILRSVFQFS